MISYFEARRVPHPKDTSYMLNNYLKQELPENKDAKILDIGCGFGQFLSKITKLGYANAYGIDVDGSAVDFCKKNNLKVSLIDDLKKFIAESKEKYDFIIMSHVIEHLKKDEIIPILTAININLLSENGKIIITTPNAQAVTGAYWHYEDFTHNLMFTSGSLYYVLYMAGFKNISFPDKYAVSDVKLPLKIIRMTAFKLYEFFDAIKNKLLYNHYHTQSEKIFTWEIRVKAEK
ncbi:MAG: class I SAM-dependent methyltransferase [Endomicrobia bacterium]|nr:class I SAM-dependent methyltransferase [Endomicrobiia bacterium]